MIGALATVTRPIRYRWDALTFRRRSGEALERLRGTAAGRPVLVVGNGPSLNQTPLADFQGVMSIGMNKIDLIFDRVSWRPDLIVCVNNLVVKQHAERFANSAIPVYLSWKSRFFLSPEQRRRVNFFLSLDTDAFATDITGGAGWGSTVTYAALQFAYFMQADPVIIVGVDHSFQTSSQARDIERRKGPDVNHFHPDYFKSGTYWGLPDLAGSERAYETARQTFAAAGRRILDATIDGRLQVFPKISITEAIQLAGGGRAD